MPLEVRHIAIRMRVGDATPPRPEPAGAPPGAAPLPPDERAAIVRDVTRAVLAALARGAER